MRHVITLTSDFGLKDHYVGTMKGVILGINPEALIVDISHSIEKYDVLSGAMMLRSFYSYYPKGTIHVAVVDPGVGSDRRPIAVEADGHYFVAPDNGILSFVLKNSGSKSVYEIKNPEYMLSNVSSTFHGRDIFAPAAAHMARGVKLNELGGKIPNPVLLEFPEPKVLPGRIVGQVLHVDSFGNLLTNIPSELVNLGTEILVGDYSLGALKNSYKSVAIGSVLSIIGSSGFLEISVNQGSAFEKFGKDIIITAVS